MDILFHSFRFAPIQTRTHIHIGILSCNDEESHSNVFNFMLCKHFTRMLNVYISIHKTYRNTHIKFNSLIRMNAIHFHHYQINSPSAMFNQCSIYMNNFQFENRSRKKRNETSYYRSQCVCVYACECVWIPYMIVAGFFHSIAYIYLCGKVNDF